MNFMIFPSYWECHVIPADFHSIIFQRGRSTTNQKPIFCLSFDLGLYTGILSAEALVCEAIWRGFAETSTRGATRGVSWRTGWLVVNMVFMTFHILGMSSSQLDSLRQSWVGWGPSCDGAQVDLLPSCASLPALWRLEVFGVSSTVWSVRFCWKFAPAIKTAEKNRNGSKPLKTWKIYYLWGDEHLYLPSFPRKKLGAKQKKTPGFWLIPIPKFLETKVSCHSASMGQGRLSGARGGCWRGIRWVVQVDMGLAKRTSKVKSELVFEATQIHYP